MNLRPSGFEPDEPLEKPRVELAGNKTGSEGFETPKRYQKVPPQWLKGPHAKINRVKIYVPYDPSFVPEKALNVKKERTKTQH